jgi:ribonuclease HI
VTPTTLTDWINSQLVQSTINTFKSDKVAGLDTLKKPTYQTPPAPDGSEPQTTYIYTDGSGNNNMFGSGFLIQTGNSKARGIVNNGPMYTVFLSEVRAIHLAVNNFLCNPPPQVQEVHIYSDSTSAIQAIKHPTSNSKLIQLTWKSLSALDACYKWSLTWVKGHMRATREMRRLTP